jgi:NAD(P)-dependent dehydrogenase (short-subunit alcohol dehydrogenase family)
MLQRVALVTGGASGIGKAIAQRLLEDGFRVIIVDRNLDVLRMTYQEMQQGSRDVYMEHVDVLQETEIIELFKACSQVHGRLDVLVNCAAMTNQKTLLATEPMEWNLIMEVNLRGVYYMCKHAYPLLKECEGAVINIASVMGVNVYPGNTAYGVSKAGLIHLTKSLASEWKKDRIRVNVISPATVDTPLLRKYMAGSEVEIEQTIAEGIMDNRIQTSEQVADVVSLFVRPEARIINGTSIVVDDGSQL